MANATQRLRNDIV